MEVPKPTDEHKKLHRLAGDWIGEEKFHPMPWDPDGGLGASKTTTRLGLDGFFVIMDTEQKRGGVVTYRGHGVFGWDSVQKKYTMHWFDTMGHDPGTPATGTWDGNLLTFQHQHAMGHGRYQYEFVDQDHYKFKMERSSDGKDWMPFMDGAYRRR